MIWEQPYVGVRRTYYILRPEKFEKWDKLSQDINNYNKGNLLEGPRKLKTSHQGGSCLSEFGKIPAEIFGESATFSVTFCIPYKNQ